MDVIETEAPAVDSEHLLFFRLLAVLVGSGARKNPLGSRANKHLHEVKNVIPGAVARTVSAVMGTGTWI